MLKNPLNYAKPELTPKPSQDIASVAEDRKNGVTDDDGNSGANRLLSSQLSSDQSEDNSRNCFLDNESVVVDNGLDVEIARSVSLKTPFI